METNLPMLFADAALVPFESPAGLHALVNPISGKYRIWILQIGLFFVIFGNPGPNKKKRKKNSHHSQNSQKNPHRSPSPFSNEKACPAIE